MSMRDYRRDMEKERSSMLGSALMTGLKVGGLSVIGYAGYKGVKNRHKIAAPLAEKIIRRQGQGLGGEILSEMNLRIRAFDGAMGQNTGFLGLVGAARNSRDFEKRLQAQTRSLLKNQRQKNRFNESPKMGRRVMEELGAGQNIHNEAQRMARSYFGKKRIESDPFFKEYVEKGFLRTAERDKLFDHHSEKNIIDFVTNNSAPVKKGTPRIDFSGKSQDHIDEFVSKLNETVKMNSQQVRFKHDKKTGNYSVADEATDMEKRYLKKNAELLKKMQVDSLMEALHRDNNKTFLSNSLEQRGYKQVLLGDLIQNPELAREVAPTVRKGDKRGPLDFVDKIIHDATQMGHKADDIEKLVVDPHWFTKDGEFFNAGHLARGADETASFLQNSFQVPFLNFNLFDLMQYPAIKQSREAPLFQVFRSGEMQALAKDGRYAKYQNPYEDHNLGARQRELAKDYVYAGGKSYDIERLMHEYENFSGNISEFDIATGLVEDNLRLVGDVGVPKRFAESIAGVSRHDARDENMLRRLWGGKQEHESIYGRLLRSYRKFDDPEYGANLVPRLLAAENGSEIQDVYKRMHGVLSRTTSGLSHDAGFIYDDVFQETSMSLYGTRYSPIEARDNPEYLLNVVQDIVKGNKKTSDTVFDDVLESSHKRVEYLYERLYERDSALFMRSKSIMPDNSLITNDFINIASIGYERLRPLTEDLRRAMDQLMLAGMPMSKGHTAIDLLESTRASGGRVDNVVIQETMDLQNLSLMEKFQNATRGKDYQVYSEEMLKFQSLFREEELTAKRMQASLERKDPWYGAGPGDDVPDHYGEDVRYHMIKKHRGMLESYNKHLADDSVIGKGVATGQAARDYVSQFFAGSKNMDDVTTSTMVPWFFASRLDDAMAQMGMGLSNRHRGSATSIVMNQWGRRIVLPYVAYQQAMYFDGLTGDFFSDRMADAYVNMHTDLATIKDVMGINQAMSGWGDVFAGGDQIGEWVPNKLINFATMGAFSDFRTAEEVEDYYVSGEDAIRKGRYWSIGSTTPWMGGKIDRYQPNWYRRMKSDYRFSENGYGSESEYWNNHWMPTLTNPLAPVRHFLLDPYHYENKHRLERPFAVTGGFAELNNIPLIGPLVDNTVGRVLKPRVEDPRLQKAHRQYLEEYNERLASAHLTAANGATVTGMPAGGIRREDHIVGVEFEPGEAGAIMAGGASAGYEEEGTGTGVPGGTGGSGGGMSGGTGAQMVQGQMAAGNMALSTPVARGFKNLYAQWDPNVVRDLGDTVWQDSLMDLRYGTARDVWYNASEMAGIFGFATKAGLGFEESGRGPTLQDSGVMSSYNRSFWDMELGGFGGDISEIARRYLARDPNRNTYNPIENTMPTWLPGPEYFTDFQHGDPYSKISAGLMRLPGDSYEKLYNVQKDVHGNYSALDRMRILGDVAPYSDQYKATKKEVSMLRQAGMLSEDQIDEVATIREQVQAKKQKKLFYERRFGEADLNHETVTVTKVLDANTFLTREYGEATPIKMAGVRVKNSDEETKAFVSQFIYEGARLKVGLDADPMFRVRDDAMNTMRAVVYTNHNEQNTEAYLSNKGSNLNYMLANRADTKGRVEVTDDGSATATHALFNGEQITVGKMWDWAVRDVAPQIPVLGVFADKFLQVRSPVDSYRRDLYGSAWRDWGDPINGWVKPMLDTMISRNPIIAAAEGYWIGRLASRNRVSGHFGNLLGLGMGLAATVRTVHDLGNDLTGGQDWIPKRRKKEREVEEYFDKLKYVKYKGLYEKTKRLALEEEGFDLDAFFREREEEGLENKGFKKYIDSRKKWLSIQEKSGYGQEEALKEERRRHNETLRQMDENRGATEFGPIAALALRYKSEFEGTVFGSLETGNVQDMMRALPTRDRDYFSAFLKAAPDEREEILRLVPTYQKPMYQQAYGMEAERGQTLRSYFKEHPLPGMNWSGWDASTSLDGVKIRVLENESISLKESGYWEDDEARAAAVKAKPIHVRGGDNGPNMDRLHKMLKGAGMQDISVSLTEVEGGSGGLLAQFDLTLDRREEVRRGLMENWTSLFT